RCRAAASLRLGDPAAAAADIQNGLALADEHTPTAALNAITGLILRDELRSPRKAIPSFAQALKHLSGEAGGSERLRFTWTCNLFDLMARMLVELLVSAPYVQLVRPVASVQFALWQACKVAHGGCTRAAVEEFVKHENHPTDESVWANEPE